jgi:8-oxo-dGTP pyrophosphatase MutT (NUDIX family)
VRFTRKWFTADFIQKQHKNIEIRQVYVWILTLDKKIVIVGKKDGTWQFPGGHPNEGETLVETAAREVFEEAGLNISKSREDLTFFGYYLIEINDDVFIQTRFMIKLDQSSEELKLNTDNEVLGDNIARVCIVSLNEVVKLIPWLGSTEEYNTVKHMI